MSRFIVLLKKKLLLQHLKWEYTQESPFRLWLFSHHAIKTCGCILMKVNTEEVEGELGDWESDREERERKKDQASFANRVLNLVSKKQSSQTTEEFTVLFFLIFIRVK